MPNVFGPSSAFIQISTQNNETFQDAFQFDPPVPGVTGPAWSLAGMSFELGIKGNKEQDETLITLTSASGQIVVDDPVNRILHMNVPDTVLNAALVPGVYVYDFVMIDTSVPPIRTVLMHGQIKYGLGVTEDT